MNAFLQSSFSFGAPLWLWALLLPPALLALIIWNTHRSSLLLHKIVAPRLAQQLTASVSWPKRWWRFFLLLAALAFIVVAAAQPRFGYTWEESKRKGRDVILVIDVSKSMLSTDATPNRLTRAKLAAQDLAGMLQGDRVGVIAFAGDAFLQAPLTADSGAVLESIQELDPNIIPVGGTNIAEAIKIAVEAFGKGESENRALVLFSDGEEIEADSIAAAREQAGNFRIFTVGVGTKNGSLIPLQEDAGGANFVKDENGQFVKSRLNEDRLRKLAEVSGGFYVHLENGPADMQRIMNEGLKKLSARDIDAKLSRHPIERYQWPLGFGLVLLTVSLLVNERRRATAQIKRPLAVAAAVLLFALPLTAPASNTGVELYNKQQYKESAEAFQKEISRRGDLAALHFDLGAAAYKTGDYGKAMEAFSRALAGADQKLQPKAEYNLGNTLYQRGAGMEKRDAKLKEWRGAVEHYEQAHKLEPENKDIIYNRDLVRKLIEDLEKQQKEQKKDQKQDQKQEQQKQQDQSKQQQQNGGQAQQQDKGGQQQDSKKDQKQQGGGEKNSQQQKPQSQQDAKNQEQKNQSSNDAKQDSSPSQNSEKNESGPKESSQGSPQEQKNSGDKSQQGRQPQEKPNPDNAPPPPSDKKFNGEVRAAQQQEKPGAEQRPAEIAEGEVKEGEMSKSQALSLLESSKSEDEHVTLTERKRATHVVKDW